MYMVRNVGLFNIRFIKTVNLNALTRRSRNGARRKLEFLNFVVLTESNRKLYISTWYVYKRIRFFIGKAIIDFKTKMFHICDLHLKITY